MHSQVQTHWRGQNQIWRDQHTRRQIRRHWLSQLVSRRRGNQSETIEDLRYRLEGLQYR